MTTNTRTYSVHPKDCDDRFAKATLRNEIALGLKLEEVEPTHPNNASLIITPAEVFAAEANYILGQK